MPQNTVLISPAPMPQNFTANNITQSSGPNNQHTRIMGMVCPDTNTFPSVQPAQFIPHMCFICVPSPTIEFLCSHFQQHNYATKHLASSPGPLCVRMQASLNIRIILGCWNLSTNMASRHHMTYAVSFPHNMPPCLQLVLYLWGVQGRSISLVLG